METSYISFFFSFYREIIKVVYITFAIAIQDLKICLGNLNLLLEKSAIWFESSIQKKKTSKQMIDALYYEY